MSHIVVSVTVDDGDAQRELSRIARGPDTIAHAAFDSRLATGFLLSQQYIHRRTGSLAATGDTDSAGRAGGAWVGQIKYGGAEGPKRPVVPGPYNARRPPSFYAYYEWRRGKTPSKFQPGSHAFDDDPALRPALDKILDDIADWMVRP
jgi:hypothetical protein